MANNQTNTLTATITGTEDTTGNVPINRGLGNLSFDSNYSDFTTYQNLATGDNSITIPGVKATQVYVKNNDQTNTIIVKFTPTGGAQQVSPVLQPGEVFILWQKAASAGISGLTLNVPGVGVTCLCEYFLGG